MSEVRKQQLKSDIAGLEADNRRTKGEISNNKSLLNHAERGSQHAKDLQNKINGAENFIRANEQRIREMKSELNRL